jgi:hypothetical protein
MNGPTPEALVEKGICVIDMLVNSVLQETRNAKSGSDKGISAGHVVDTASGTS